MTNILFQILATVGVAGVLAVGVWVGIMQATIAQHAVSIANLTNTVNADHDLLIEIRTKVDMILDSQKAVKDLRV